MIRAPNHLGDVVMGLPAMLDDGGDIAVRQWLAPLVEMAAPGRPVIAVGRGWRGWSAAAARVRRGRYDEGVLLSPAFSAALLFRMAGVGRLRGTATDGRSFLLADRIPRSALRGMHRIDQYRLLLGQERGRDPRHPALTPPEATVASWRDRLGGASGPVVGLFPGSNAGARRWPLDRYREVAGALANRGARVVVLGGPGDLERTAQVAAAAPGGVDAGGQTDLQGLAALLSLCQVVVTNDTGPLHLAAAVGAPTVSVWGPSDPDEVAPGGTRHARITGPPLPCKPCLKNECRRRGKGTVLDRGTRVERSGGAPGA